VIGRIINSMKNLHARKECVSDRSWIVFKVLYCRLGYGVEITLQVFHFLALTCGRPPRRLHGPERWGRCCASLTPASIEATADAESAF
jgi:hypothetical protein